MASGTLKIHDNGKITLEGVVFDSHGEYAFEAFLDTGCTDYLVLDQRLADAVCAEVIQQETRSVGAGASQISGLIRRVNLRFGELEVRNVEVFVPNSPVTRNLIGMSFLQKIAACLVLDFGQDKTKGCVFTTDRFIPYIIGKACHLYCSHKHWVVDTNPCHVCGATGDVPPSSD